MERTLGIWTYERDTCTDPFMISGIDELMKGVFSWYRQDMPRQNLVDPLPEDGDVDHFPPPSHPATWCSES